MTPRVSPNPDALTEIKETLDAFADLGKQCFPSGFLPESSTEFDPKLRQAFLLAAEANMALCAEPDSESIIEGVRLLLKRAAKLAGLDHGSS